ncbi:GNAT family N-acetyltransferase [Halosegnis rubeus]|jgi:GNAT superfamily N-acetyltransferase|uniref:GNAT family N-acetyltransferase n=1 Tax=Halosegnis rubeus TaxID=2212850 RepID=A0A5N5UCI6_9EURY|nr:GNAT family N-acetyltransferase [Halosegnis rubeus]KAB7515259.1 GNAT family N-acetyltransferase [Halosegnis rubeus]KAB7516313.1 GNAT family N-acetyltransferase [Halosegnis rubeus]KAB7517699.1 GNAT family N-acetyltransferase [Halosegnis rubeus]
MSRIYPDEVAGPYDPPPRSLTDKAGRDIEIRRFEDDMEALVSMYLDFDPEDRAQGIPPTTDEQIREWLDTIVTEAGVNVIAWHDGDAVGHATLVPDFDDNEGTEGLDEFELAIFVLAEYQESGIGSQLITALLGAGRAEEIDRVWLTVERWNHAAVALYEKVGFEPSDTGSFELEMGAKLR